MAFDELAVLDPSLVGSTGAMAYGSESAVGFRTDYIELKSGALQRVARWGSGRLTFDLSKLSTNNEQLAALRTFFRARGGGARGFRLKDINDYASNATGMLPGDGTGHSAISSTDQLIGTGDGTTVTFQLIKRYTDGGNTEVRNIEKPVSGTVLIAVAGVLKTETTDYTIDYASGIVTFGTAPTLGQAVTAGFLFHVPACFGPGTDKALSIRRDDWGKSSCSARIEAIELIGASPVQDDVPTGGASSAALTATPRVWSPSEGSMLWTPSANATVILPLASTMPVGYWADFENTSGSFTIAHKAGGVTQFTLATSGSRTAVVMLNGATRVWKAY